MTNKEFEVRQQELSESRNSDLVVKGKEYTRGDGDADRLINFKRVAANLGLTPRQAWALYFLKHVDSILTWAKGGEFSSEPAIKRFGDAINYLELGYGLYVEETTSTSSDVISTSTITWTNNVKLPGT